MTCFAPPVFANWMRLIAVLHNQKHPVQMLMQCAEVKLCVKW